MFRRLHTLLRLPSLLPLVLVLLAPSVSSAQEREYDVVVYGGTASGVISAVAAAREGASVALLEPRNNLGGMVSGGLGATDAGRVDTIGGIALEFFTRLGAHYGRGGPTFRHEPHVAEKIFREMAAESGVDVFFQHRLREQDGVETAGRAIRRIHTENGTIWRARVFIDTSYEADLMAQSGVSYHVGRESADTHNESLAGIRRLHYYGKPEIAYDEHGLLPGISPESPGEIGDGDRNVQSYNFRLCLSRNPENQIPISKPADYDPRRYTLLARVMMRRPDIRLASVLSIAELPNDKSDVNNIGSLSTDHVGANRGYPEGTYAEREKIWNDHRNYIHGLLYFLGNDPRVPENLRAEMRQWGFAADEFTDNDHWPHQLYIRVARRMIGEYVMTERDLKENIEKPDSIAMGSYFLDSHYVRRILTEKGVAAEGNLGGDHRVFPYEIPYRSLTPKIGEIQNLLVPVALSASHVAYASLRMEPVYMMTGHAAGIAAAMAAERRIPVQQIPYPDLETKLRSQKQILEYQIPGRVDPADLSGILVDETEARLSGGWLKSTSGEPFVGLGYAHDNNVHKGRRTATFTPEIPESGSYNIRLFFAPLGNRATNVPVKIRSADGEKTVTVNQRQRFPDGQQSLDLGTFRFEKGRSGSVEISNAGTDGVVVADAVQFLPFKPESAKSAIPSKSETRAAIQLLRELLRASQLPDGAIRTRPHGNRVRIVPYFANIAAIALLSAHEIDPVPADLDRVRNWLHWYVRHQEPDGTIQDYSGTLDNYARLDHRDSTDSYAATFLMALWRYSQTGNLEAFDPDLIRAAESAVDAIALTFDETDGLTWAKPEYRVKFPMDNIEVWIGLHEGAQYLRAANRIGKAAAADKMRRAVQTALPQFWLPENGFFAWAKGSSGAFHIRFDRWYPDGIVNIFALTHLNPPPAGLWEKLQKQFASEPQLTPDWWLRAAWNSGTEAERAHYLRQTVDFAQSMKTDTHGINRYATTLLALLGESALWPAVPANLPSPP